MYAHLLALLGDLPPYRFVVPDQVLAEITRPEQRALVEDAIATGTLTQRSVSSIEGLRLFAELTQIMGRGEAACLAMAVTEGLMIASDEKKRFRREARRRLGEQRILTTVDVFLLAIRQRKMTLNEADEAKAVLAANRFQMDFDSFVSLLGDEL